MKEETVIARLASWSIGVYCTVLTIFSLPGQRLSACTCKGEDHPGPDVSYGRGTPEIDIIEVSLAAYTFRSIFIARSTRLRVLIC
jgi:hypothetical protein